MKLKAIWSETSLEGMRHLDTLWICRLSLVKPALKECDIWILYESGGVAQSVRRTICGVKITSKSWVTQVRLPPWPTELRKYPHIISYNYTLCSFICTPSCYMWAWHLSVIWGLVWNIHSDLKLFFTSVKKTPLHWSEGPQGILNHFKVRYPHQCQGF